MWQVGEKIRSLEATPGHVRHDILVEKGRVGRLIGPQGTTLKALLASSQVEALCHPMSLTEPYP